MATVDERQREGGRVGPGDEELLPHPLLSDRRRAGGRCDRLPVEVQEQDPALHDVGERGGHLRDAAPLQHRPRQRVFGVDGPLQGVVLLGQQPREHRLGDRDERHVVGDLEHREPELLGLRDERPRGPGVPEPDAEPQTRDARVDEAADVRALGGGRRPETQSGREDELSALEPRGRVLEFGAVDPPERLGGEPLPRQETQGGTGDGHDISDRHRHDIHGTGWTDQGRRRWAIGQRVRRSVQSALAFRDGRPRGGPGMSGQTGRHGHPAGTQARDRDPRAEEPGVVRPPRRRRPDRGRQPPPGRDRPGEQRDHRRRRREPPDRLRHRHRGAERGARRARGRGRRPAPGRARHPHLLPRDRERAVHRARGAPQRDRADRRPGEDDVRERRGRGRGERGEDRAQGHGPHRRRGVRPRVPRADAHGDDAHRQEPAVQGRDGPVRARGLPAPVRLPLPLPDRGHARDLPGGVPALRAGRDAQTHRRGADRGRHPRADPGRGGVHRARPGVHRRDRRSSARRTGSS